MTGLAPESDAVLAAPAGGGRTMRSALRSPAVLAGLALVVISRLLLMRLAPGANEDAYITFRYARAFAQGLGAVYNPGEHVLGYTSPLWMAWVSVGIRLGADAVAWARWTGVAADLVTLAALTGLLERHASRASAWCFAVLFGAWPFFAAVAVSGLESSTLLALLAVAGWLVAARSAWAGLALGALCLARPEGLVCALVLSPWANGRARVAGAAILAAGIATLAFAYGSPLSQSVMAKASVYGTPGVLASRQWWDWILPFDLGGWPVKSDTAQLWTLRMLLAPAAVSGVLVLRRTPLLPVALAGLAVWACYIVTGTAYFFWYLILPAAVTALLASAGLPRIVRGPWLYVTAAAIIAGGWTYQPNFYRSRAGIEHQVFGGVAIFLQGQSRPGESVLLEPIGIVGWLNPRLLVRDEVGLVTPWVATRRTQAPGWYADALKRYRPDWLVVRHPFLERPVAFNGAGVPFRDSLEFVRALSGYRTVYQTSRTPGEMDLDVLRRAR